MNRLTFCFYVASRFFTIPKENSYYPELPRKKYWRMVMDNIKWFAKRGDVNDFYMLYGLDIKGSSEDGFIDFRAFANSRNKKNKVGSPLSQAALLRDKFLFYKFMKMADVPVPEVFAVIKGGKLYDTNWNELDDSFLDDKKDFFLKDAAGECASFVKHCEDKSEYKKYLPELKDDVMYILQDTLYQHKEMCRLNPYSVNTIRIVTVRKSTGDPYVLTALLRVGTKASGKVDNWAAGGLAVGCEADGRLKKYGFYKPIHGVKAEIHPDTDVVFDTFTIPMYKEAVKLVVKAHKQLYGIHSIGWDVAITDKGPMLIEGNDNWEISLMQVADRKLEQEWFDSLK